MATAALSACSSCLKLSASLLDCGSCRTVKYCDRTCQKAHWKAHKKACREFLKANLDEVGNSIREAKVNSRPILNVSGVYGDNFPENFSLKQQATTVFFMEASMANGKIGGYKSEAVYRAYFDDLVTDKATWMSMFEVPENFQHAENTCGILGTLATLYRVDGKLEICEKVLDMEQDVLIRYQRVIEGKDHAQVVCCDELAYKYYLVRYNMHFQKKQYNKCIDYFRKLLDHELKYEFDFEAQNFLFMVTMILGKNPSKQVVDRLSEKEMLKLVKAPLTMM